jgi:hypothetical protein
MSASRGYAKQPILTAYNEGSDGVLGKVIIDVNVAVLRVAN